MSLNTWTRKVQCLLAGRGVEVLTLANNKVTGLGKFILFSGSDFHLVQEQELD